MNALELIGNVGLALHLVGLVVVVVAEVVGVCRTRGTTSRP